MPSRLASAKRSRELMRYVRISQPEIIDLERRAKGSPQLAEVAAKPAAERVTWAARFVEQNELIVSTAQLGFDYFSHLAIDALPVDVMPSAKDLLAPEAFAKIAPAIRSDARYVADVENLLASTFALRVLGDPRFDTSRRLFAFVDSFPELATRTRTTPYPYPVLTRLERKPKQRKAAKPESEVPPNPQQELATLARDVEMLWRARNQLVQGKRAELEAALRAAPAPSTAQNEQVAMRAPLHTRRQLMRSKQSADAAIAGDHLETLLDADPQELARYAPGVSDLEIVRAQASVRSLANKNDLRIATIADTYAGAIAQLDAKAGPLVLELDVEKDCFKERPTHDLVDSVRMLGKADLVKVTETFMYYSEGELSYVENILSGERRLRRVKNRKYFEEVLERTTTEESEQSNETDVTTKQDLGSQIESEISARMNTDVNTSANGSGGGKLGVVDFKGSASAAANVGIGFDSKFGSKSTSNFSQEIVTKAIERTKSITTERRVSKSTSLYMTIDEHEITNTGGSRNGHYCFLDKHVCINELVYGKRAFLLAQLGLPGRNLLCERKLKVKLGLADLGQRPTFTISVDDISPSTYKDYVAQYKATNVEPPPSPLQTIARTYKTDSTSASSQAPAMKLTEAAQLLSPFFEEYKRFLITDTVKLPDGYEVAQVYVTVNHGANGISLPIHLPLKVTGAALGSAVTMLSGFMQGVLGPAIIVPFAAWQFIFGASPLLHYNTDSSNVTVCVGNESHDSPYFFFDAAYLMEELFDLMGSLLAQAPDLVEKVRAKAQALLDKLKPMVEAIPGEIATQTRSALDALIKNIESVGGSIGVDGNVKDGFTAFFKSAISAVSVSAPAFPDVISEVKAFVDEVAGLFAAGFRDAFADFLSFATSVFPNTQTLPFYPRNVRGELPVSINTVAIRPGITINLSALVVRTDEALDKWRLETFERLYQAYVQQVAEYDARVMSARRETRGLKSPGTLRAEELLALKELVMYALNTLHDPAHGNKYTPEALNLFENAIDWENLSYRLFNYGPSYETVSLEKQGVFEGVDDRRVAFLKASWAQVMIPLQENEQLEAQTTQYFADGSTNFEARFGTTDEAKDELTALYQALVQERALLAKQPDVICLGEEVLPTDFIVVVDERPGDPDALCEPTVVA